MKKRKPVKVKKDPTTSIRVTESIVARVRAEKKDKWMPVISFYDQAAVEKLEREKIQ